MKEFAACAHTLLYLKRVLFGIQIKQTQSRILTFLKIEIYGTQRQPCFI